MGWRVAKSLKQLQRQLDRTAPDRSVASDGYIGDADHASRSSDHNPWVRDGDKGVVTAGDYTHDPDDGADMHRLADALVRSRDPRIEFVIWNRRIWSSARAAEGWRRYAGSNPHTKHLHVSVQPDKRLYDSEAAWAVQPPADSPTRREDDMARLVRNADTNHVYQVVDAETLKYVASAAVAAELDGPDWENRCKRLPADHHLFTKPNIKRTGPK